MDFWATVPIQASAVLVVLDALFIRTWRTWAAFGGKVERRGRVRHGSEKERVPERMMRSCAQISCSSNNRIRGW